MDALTADLTACPLLIQPTPGSFRYHAKHNFKDEEALMRWIRAKSHAVPFSEIRDSFAGAEAAILRLIEYGVLITIRAIGNSTELFLFARKEEQQVPCSGTIEARPGDEVVSTSADLTTELQRGDVVILDGQFYRVSRVVKKGRKFELGPAPENLAETGGQYTAAADEHPRWRSAAGEPKWAAEFSSTQLPLDRPYEGVRGSDIPIARLGAHTDLRLLWRNTAENVGEVFDDACPRSHVELRRRLKTAGLDSSCPMRDDTLTMFTGVGSKRPRRRTVRKAADKHAFGKENEHLLRSHLGTAIQISRVEHAEAEHRAAVDAAAADFD